MECSGVDLTSWAFRQCLTWLTSDTTPQSVNIIWSTFPLEMLSPKESKLTFPCLLPDFSRNRQMRGKARSACRIQIDHADNSVSSPTLQRSRSWNLDTTGTGREKNWVGREEEWEAMAYTGSYQQQPLCPLSLLGFAPVKSRRPTAESNGFLNSLL